MEDKSSRVADELYVAMRPMLAVSNGELILMSTPDRQGHDHSHQSIALCSARARGAHPPGISGYETERRIVPQSSWLSEAVR